MNGLPRLSRELVASPLIAGADGVDLPPAHVLDLPERVVQFGTGAFLRAFAAWFIDEANRAGRFNGSIVAVASTGSNREAVLNAQDGLFTLTMHGTPGHSDRPRHRVVASVSRALSASGEWDAVLALARDPAIALVISNTTEVGLARDARDAFDAAPPQSFPAKLTRWLFERATTFGFDAGRGGIVVLPSAESA